MKYKISIYFANKLNSLDLIFYSYKEYSNTLAKISENFKYGGVLIIQGYNIKLDHICYYKGYSSES